MEKDISFKVICENGDVYVWRFIEHYIEDTYGNGKYIAVLINGKKAFTIDMRYQAYVFKTWCESYIKMYYGLNLFKYERI